MFKISKGFGLREFCHLTFTCNTSPTVGKTHTGPSSLMLDMSFYVVCTVFLSDPEDLPLQVPLQNLKNEHYFAWTPSKTQTRSQFLHQNHPKLKEWAWFIMWPLCFCMRPLQNSTVLQESWFSPALQRFFIFKLELLASKCIKAAVCCF